MKEVISVRFRSGCKNYYFSPGQLTVAPGQDVIVETAQGPEYVTCTQGNHDRGGPSGGGASAPGAAPGHGE